MATQDKPNKGHKYGDDESQKRGVTGEMDAGVEKGDAEERQAELGREWDESAVETEQEPVIHVELDDDGNIKEPDES